MLDGDLRDALRTRLQAEHGASSRSTLIVDELGLCGTARVDVAVVDTALTGYELKSERDKLDRLPNQVATYGRVLDYAYLVVARKHLAAARQILPQWWGILVAHAEDDSVVLAHQRKARRNTQVDAHAVAQLLWRSEALDLLTRYQLDFGHRGKPRHALWEQLATRLELDTLKVEVRQTLKVRRGWRENPGQRGYGATLQPSSRSQHFLARRLR